MEQASTFMFLSNIKAGIDFQIERPVLHLKGDHRGKAMLVATIDLGLRFHLASPRLPEFVNTENTWPTANVDHRDLSAPLSISRQYPSICKLTTLQKRSTSMVSMSQCSLRLVSWHLVLIKRPRLHV